LRRSNGINDAEWQLLRVFRIAPTCFVAHDLRIRHEKKISSGLIYFGLQTFTAHASYEHVSFICLTHFRTMFTLPNRDDFHCLTQHYARAVSVADKMTWLDDYPEYPDAVIDLMNYINTSPWCDVENPSEKTMEIFHRRPIALSKNGLVLS
jgi:hypothetical protein